jgi:lipoprotein NlpD
LVFFSFILVGCPSLEFLKGDGSGRHYGQPRYHTVKPGETLYSIAWTYGYDYQTVARWNNIKPPYIIHVGQRLRVAPPPGEEQMVQKRHQQSPPPTQQEQQKQQAQKQQEQAKKWHKASISWQWPTQGQLIEGYSASNKGLNIAGANKQPIYAAADGVVVYSGNGLRGYGNLIIIKHNEVYLSAYAHNREIFVKEGTKVEKGQRIASMGDTDAERVMLHFEIRRDGKPVDPIAFLPKRN